MVESLEDLTKTACGASRMSEHLLFLTGHLALPRLGKVLAAMQPTPFTFEVRDIGVKVASLMTPTSSAADCRSRCRPTGSSCPDARRGDLDALAQEFGVPFSRGPDDLKDLPEFFGRQGQAGRSVAP